MSQPVIQRTSDAVTRYPRRSRFAALCTWCVAAAISTATAWLLGLRFGQLLFGTPPLRAAAPFTAITASVLGDSVPALLSSALFWATIGFAVGGFVFATTQTPPKGTPVRHSSRSLEWAFASAICAGLLWALGQAAVMLALGGGRFPEHAIQEWEGAFLERIGIGLGVGLVVGLPSGCVLDRFRSARRLALWTVGCTILSGFGGAVCLLAEFLCHGVLLPPVASSLGAAVAGFFAGLFAEGFSKRSEKDERSLDPDDEPLPATPDDTPRPSPRADVRVRRRPRRSPLLRFLPALTVSAVTVIVAVLVYSSLWAVLLGLTGLLGLSIVPILWNQEKRLTALEARFWVEREP